MTHRPGHASVGYQPGQSPSDRRAAFDLQRRLGDLDARVEAIETGRVDTWNFPASEPLISGSFTNLAMSLAAGGDGITEVVNLGRPGGWAGPLSCACVKFKVPGIYSINGNLIPAATITTAESYLGPCDETGASLSAAQAKGNMNPWYGPMFYTGNFLWALTLIVRDPAHFAFRTAVYHATGGTVNTWSAPGQMTIVKVG